MDRNVLIIDFFMEIRKNLPRFLSVLLIVALGTAFFSGIKATKPDMQKTAEAYYDESNLMDLRIVSALGLTEDDLAAVREIEGVDTAVGIYATDVICAGEENNYVLRVSSYTPDINCLTILEGREPQFQGECVMDQLAADAMELSIGDTVTVESGTTDALSETLSVSTYTVVGIANSPQYLWRDRDSTTIGNGTVSGFMVVLPEVFETEAYAQIDVTVQGALDLNSFKRAYEKKVDAVADRIEEIQGEHAQARYDEVYEAARAEVEEAEAALETAQTELSDAKAALDAAETEIEQAKAEINEKLEQILSGETTIEEQEATVVAAEEALAQAKETLDATEAELLEKQLALEAARQQLTTSQLELVGSWSQWTTQSEELTAQRETLSQLQEALSQQETEINEKYTQLDALYTDLSLKQDDEKRNATETTQVNEDGTTETVYVIDTTASDAIQEEITALEEEITALEESYAQAKSEAETLAANIETAQEELNATWTELDNIGIQLEAEDATLTASETELAASQAQFTLSELEYEQQEATVKAAREALDAAKASIESGQTSIESAQTEISAAEAELEEKKAAYEENYAESQQNLNDATEELNEAKRELLKMEVPEWSIYDRSSISSVESFSQDADRIGAIGNVVPVIFYLIAALVSLTAITRMVDEQRTEIGTLKALGYDKRTIVAKYVCYALLASVLGGILGILIGQTVLPRVIINAYKTMYYALPKVKAPLHLGYSLLALLLAAVCTAGAAVAACYRKLMDVPAQLMRPESPKAGKRVFLEKWTFLWRHLNFSQKAAVRNLFRYKKRLIMTVFGIASCTALLIVGFGLKNSISAIGTKEFGELQKYDAEVVLTDTSVSAMDELEETVAQDADVKDYTYIYKSSLDVGYADTEKSAYLIVVEDTERFSQFQTLRSRTSGETLSIPEEGVILSEKLAKLLDVSVGDTVYLKDSENLRVEAEVTGITETYYRHYIYMSQTQYAALYGGEATTNELLVCTTDTSDDFEDAFSETYIVLDAVGTVVFNSNTQTTIDNILKNMDVIVAVLIISAALLAFVVLYNVNYINITERRRELATIKVLGFYPIELTQYVLRENIMLTVLGILFGLVFGFFLHRFVILTAEIDLMMFVREIKWWSYLLSVLLTIAFSACVNVIMHFSLKKIDMIESLKSVE